MDQIDLKLIEKVPKAAQDVMKPYFLTEDQIDTLRSVMRSEMQTGLSDDPKVRASSSLAMLCTHVYHLCNGTEQGDYLGLDLGGTNFRVLYIRVGPGGVLERNVCRYYNCTEEHLTSTAEVLFDHIASSIARFIKEEQVPAHCEHNPLPLGFSFSFPMDQPSLQSGILLTWTKTFRNTTGVGLDAVQLLQNAIKQRHEVNVEVLAIMNDTTGTMMSGSIHDPEITVGMIIGTGANACYLERIDRVPKWMRPVPPTPIIPNGKNGTGNASNGTLQHLHDHQVPHTPEEKAKELAALTKAYYEGEETVVIDTEWGALGDNGSLDFLRTAFDVDIDLHSNHLHSYTFEKLFSGMYLGEVARLPLLHLVENGHLFANALPTGPDGKPRPPLGLSTRWAFASGFVSKIERSRILRRVQSELSGIEAHQQLDEVLERIGIEPSALSKVTETDLATLRYVCAAISLRAAQLVAAVLVELGERVEQSRICVAVDGSLYLLHPTIRRFITYFAKLWAPKKEYHFIEASDGSGRGAALVAAVVDRRRRSLRAQLA